MLSSNTILYPLQEVSSSKGEVSHPQFKAGRVNLIIKIKSEAREFMESTKR